MCGERNCWQGKGNRKTFFTETEYAVKDDGAKRFPVRIRGEGSSCRIGSRVSHTVPTALVPGRIRVTGFERRPRIESLGGITERRFLHSSTIFRRPEENEIAEGSNTNIQIRSEQVNTTNKMGSDEDYMAFLNKANEDPSAGTSKTASNKKTEFKTMDDDVDVPGVLIRATKDAWYVSDADEPFVVVALKNEGKSLPDEGMYTMYPDSKDKKLMRSRNIRKTYSSSFTGRRSGRYPNNGYWRLGSTGAI